MLQVDIRDGLKLVGVVEPICQLPFSVDDARQRFGWHFLADDEFTLFALLLCDGLPLVVEGLDPKHVVAEAPQARGVVVSIDAHWPDSRNALSRVLVELALCKSDLPWIAPELGRREWAVERLDDNGNEFVIAYGRTEAEAEAVAKRSRSLGHKQSYQVRRIDR